MTNRQAQTLADFGLFAFQCDDVDTLLNHASELVSKALDVHYAKVLQHFPERGEMLMRGGVNWEPGVVGHETFGDHEKSPGGFALRADRPVVSRDLSVEHRFETPEVLLRHRVQSMVNVIIVGNGAPFGVLEVDARQPRDFDEDDVTFLQTYANLLAAAIDRIRIHEELRHSAREQSVLAQELGHRVKNVLGLVRALASQTSTQDRTADEFRKAFIDRLQALSVAENMVFDSAQDRVDLMTLSEKILAAYRQDDPGKIAISGPAITILGRRARMFGLALHELATNAAKYGALSVPDGQVRLDWEFEDAKTQPARVAMTWQEADGPEIKPPDRKGFGSRLLQDVIAYELKGDAVLTYETWGLHYQISFPVDKE